MIESLEEEVEIFERHLRVLKLVNHQEPIGIVKLSEETGYPDHKIRYSLRVLEEEGLVEPSAQGALTTERTESFLKTLDKKIKEITEKLEKIKPDKI